MISTYWVRTLLTRSDLTLWFYITLPLPFPQDRCNAQRLPLSYASLLSKVIQTPLTALAFPPPERINTPQQRTRWTSNSVSTSLSPHPTNQSSILHINCINRSYSRYRKTSKNIYKDNRKMKILNLLIPLPILIGAANATPADDMQNLRASYENASSVLNASLNQTSGMVS